MNTIKFIVAVSIVLLGTDLIYYQVVNGQNNDTAKIMVDKLIQDTKIENATEESYRAAEHLQALYYYLQQIIKLLRLGASISF
jgi:hypothetical protein